MQFFTLYSSKMEIFETLYVFFTLFGCWGGAGGRLPRGLGHNLLVQFSSLGGSKMEISATDFSDTLTIQNDQISIVCCVNGGFCVGSQPDCMLHRLFIVS